MFYLEGALVTEELEWIEFVVVLLMFRSAKYDTRLLARFRRLGVGKLGFCRKINVGQIVLFSSMHLKNCNYRKSYCGLSLRMVVARGHGIFSLYVNRWDSN